MDWSNEEEVKALSKSIEDFEFNILDPAAKCIIRCYDAVSSEFEPYQMVNFIKRLSANLKSHDKKFGGEEKIETAIALAYLIVKEDRVGKAFYWRNQLPALESICNIISKTFEICDEYGIKYLDHLNEKLQATIDGTDLPKDDGIEELGKNAALAIMANCYKEVFLEKLEGIRENLGLNVPILTEEFSEKASPAP